MPLIRSLEHTRRALAEHFNRGQKSHGGRKDFDGQSDLFEALAMPFGFRGVCQIDLSEAHCSRPDVAFYARVHIYALGQCFGDEWDEIGFVRRCCPSRSRRSTVLALSGIVGYWLPMNELEASRRDNFAQELSWRGVGDPHHL